MGEDAGVAWENAECGNLHGKFADRQSASQFAKGTMVVHAQHGRPPGAAVGPRACKLLETCNICDGSPTLSRSPPQREKFVDEKLLT
jgi:hypothetical protein